MEQDLKLVLAGDNEGATYEIHVWQHVMANASPYFRAMLSPDKFAEGGPSKKGSIRELNLQETNARAMQILSDIFHLRSKSIPVETLSSDDLVNVAILVDKMDCMEAVQPWTQKWMEQKHLMTEMDAVHEMSIENLAKWACVCHVFGHADRAQRFLHRLTLYMTSSEPADGGLPYLDYVPQILIEKAQNKRTEIVNKFQQITADLVRRLQQGQSCRLVANKSEDRWFMDETPTDAEAFHCSSILLGNALLAISFTIGDISEPEAWLGSIAVTHKKMLKIAEKLNGPSSLPRGPYSKKVNRRHGTCSWTSRFNDEIEKIIAEVDPYKDGEERILPQIVTTEFGFMYGGF